MNIQLLAFGIVRDILNTSSTSINVPERIIVKDFKIHLIETFPKMKNVSSFAIAVNESYAQDSTVLQENDVVAIIPPVSGG
ncbi:MoaD/ThiS family protein [Tenacibaculum sp. 190524A02b]|uniref:Molybdopterin synthase sulfur carrier subunit n=1 Tax=Tenacibaculum vairaonense TaxID=3137860 RepID=A0ABM9PQT7_9FLAO